MGAHAYVASNALTGLAASAFAWYTASGTPSSGAFTPSPDNRSYLNDGRMDRQLTVAASAASGLNVIIDMGAATQLVGIAILNSNPAVQDPGADMAVAVHASSNATFAADVNAAKASSTLYSALSPRNKDHVLQWNQSLNKRYWRITWEWSGGNITNFRVGELIAFTASTQLTRRTIYGSGEGKKFFSASEQFSTGERRAMFLGGPQRMLSMLFSDLNATQRDELDAMWGAVKGNVSKLLWIDSYEAVATAAAAAEQNCVWGRLDEDELAFPEDDFALYNMRGFTLRSLGREAGA